MYEDIKNDKEKRETYKVVLMSDVHLDVNYTEGTIKNCNLPVCCNVNNGYTSDPALSAGPFGEYQCDLPTKTFNSMLEHLRDEVKPEAIFWPGDNSVHEVWKNKEDSIIKYTDIITEMINEHFPKKSIGVFPTLGNHDTWPVNVEDFGKAEGSKPVVNYDKVWADYFTTPEAKE